MILLKHVSIHLLVLFLIYMTVPLRISSVNVGSEKIEQASREEIANVLKIL